MPKKVDWATSAVRLVVLEDHKSGDLPDNAEDMSARDAWDQVYKNLIEFHGVEYEHFRDNLNSMRKAFRKRESHTSWAKNAIQHDLGLDPRLECDDLGEAAFAFSPALKLLRKDVQKKDTKK